MNNKQNDMIRLTGIWKNKSKAGKTYLSGLMSPTSRLLIFPNEHKAKDSDPDYIAFLAPNEKREEPGQGKQPPQEDDWI